ncbi:hypothetical protein [Desulfitobacterium chlororespirans]|uniref:Uncharacterized protein n=1 Tax=Desulfitobacterium chlororespirans DSM 11544 TaxID=1121395 RepID=A0A1M7TNW0_9FIRM|nr:hypothetical protein [Desulfitobacterium chlororespirans]SHN72429.1 hypothetical protein SAMN02745215_02304 [Desulfitobacterium chlororespirans DSM 11544]
MKRKKTLIAALALAFVATAGASAYAATPEIKDISPNTTFTIQTYADGEMPVLPEGAIDLNKVIFSEGKISFMPVSGTPLVNFAQWGIPEGGIELKIYAEGELPVIPEGAIKFNMVQLPEGAMSIMPIDAQFMHKMVVEE